MKIEKIKLEKEIEILEDLETEYEVISRNSDDEQEKLSSYLRFLKQKRKVARLKKDGK